MLLSGPRPIAAATRTRTVAVPSHCRDPPSRHRSGVAPPLRGVTRRPLGGRGRGRPVRRRTPPAIRRPRGRTDPGSRGHVGLRTGNLCRGGAAVRSRVASRQDRDAAPPGAPEHLAERQAHECCDHGPDEETARNPQDPHIPPRHLDDESSPHDHGSHDMGSRSGGPPG
jgi:hypothetical protein